MTLDPAGCQRRAHRPRGRASLLAPVVLGPLLRVRATGWSATWSSCPHQPWKVAWLGLGRLACRGPCRWMRSSRRSPSVVPGVLGAARLPAGAAAPRRVGVGRLVRDHAWYARAAAIAPLLLEPVGARPPPARPVGDPGRLPRAAVGGARGPPAASRPAHRVGAGRRGADDSPRVCSPSSGVMAVVVLAVLGLRRRRLRGSWSAGSRVANLPWLVPSLLAATGGGRRRDGVFDVPSRPGASRRWGCCRACCRSGARGRRRSSPRSARAS